MRAATDSLVRDTVARETARLRAELEDLKGALAAAMLTVEAAIERDAARQAEIDRVIAAATEGAAALLKAEREETADKLMRFGRTAESDSQTSEHGAEFYAARAAAYYHAAQVVLGRGKVVLA